MSLLLIEFTRSFVNGRLNTTTFVDAYMELWKIERNTNLGLNDDKILSEVLSSIFCIVDLYNHDEDKEEYEFDDGELFQLIKVEITKLNEQK